MDNKKFGQFILKLRKEKGWTQLELAEKLNITDKAVSKWERGTGFPDIKMIEPLAEVFNVSILEIMQSERIPGQTIPKDNASEAINNVIDVVAFQRKIERRNIIITATASHYAWHRTLSDRAQYLQSPASFNLCCHIGVRNTGFIISVTYFSVFMLCFRIGRTGSDLGETRILERFSPPCAVRFRFASSPLCTFTLGSKTPRQVFRHHSRAGTL